MLEKAKLIRRVHGLPEGMLSWVMTEHGLKTVGSGYPIKIPNRNTIGHDLGLVDLRISLDSIGLFDSWRPEHDLKANRPAQRLGDKEACPVPDALITTRRSFDKDPSFRVSTVAIELELFQKERGRYRKLFEYYRSLRNLFAVWYFVPTVSLGRSIETVWNSIPKGFERVPFLFLTPIKEALNDPRSMHTYSKGEVTLMRKIFDISPNPAAVEREALPAQTLLKGSLTA
jgi:hypothetical protein